MRTLLKSRYLLPATVVIAVTIGGIFAFGGVAAAGKTSPAVTQGIVYKGVYYPPGSIGVSSCGGTYMTAGVTAAKDAGGPVSSLTICKNGKLAAYGNSSIAYVNTSTAPAVLALGDQLFQQNCSSCHGPGAQGQASGVSATGAPAGTSTGYPDLRELGPATVEFWVDTGRMPAANPNSVQATRKPPRLTPSEAAAVAAWIQSLTPAPATPFVPEVNLKTVTPTDVGQGASLFALDCAACHTITGSGDALAYSTFAPSLRKASADQIAEAVRTGPGNMPRFTGNLTDDQLRDVVAYVHGYIQHPTDPGGNQLGGVGPVTEGFVGLLFGVGGFCLICFWIGDRERRHE